MSQTPLSQVKRAKLQEVQQERTFVVGKKSFVGVLDYSVVERKSAAIPYLMYVPYSIKPCSSLASGATAYTCSFAGCEQVCIEKDVSITSNLRNHLQNAHWTSPSWKQLLSKQGFSEVSNSTDEYVRMIARSGIAYYSFTESDALLRADLASFGIQVCSPNTFRERLFRISQATVTNMFQNTRGALVHMISDASPSKIKDEYVDCTITFFDRNDKFCVMSLGARQVLGSLDTASYKRLLVTVSQNWGGRFPRESDSLVPGSINIGDETFDEMVIASSCSDMGPGAHGAFQSLVGSNIHLPCCAHGANIIVRDAAESDPDIATLYLRMEELLTGISQTQRDREILQGYGISVPPKVKKIRWNSRYKLLSYYVDNVVLLTRHFAQFASLDFPTLSMLHAMLRPLAEVVDHLQVIGPCDAIKVPLLLLGALKKLIEPVNLVWKVVDGQLVRSETGRANNSVGSQFQQTLGILQKVRRTMVWKILRRFFHGAFPSLETEYNANLSETSIRQWNLFENDMVLAAFHCLPHVYSSFTFLSASRLLTECSPDMDVLNRAGAAAFKKIASRLCEVQSTPSSVPFSIQDSSLVILDLSEDETEPQPSQVELTVFRASRAIKEAMNRLVLEHDLAAREAFSRAALSEARDRSLKKVLAVLLSKPLTTVKCETNFGVVQRLLSSARLRFRTRTLTGYYLHALNQDWLMLPEQEVKKTSSSTLDKFFLPASGVGTLGTRFQPTSPPQAQPVPSDAALVVSGSQNSPVGLDASPQQPSVGNARNSSTLEEEDTMHTHFDDILDSMIMPACATDIFEANPLFEDPSGALVLDNVNSDSEC